MIIVLIFIGVLLFVCGVAFLFKGYVSVPASDSIVPIKDFENLKKELELAKNEGSNLKKQLDSLAIELDHTKVKLQGMQGSKETIKQLQTLDEENKAKILDLDQRLSAFMAKAEQQAKEALEVINTLTKDNETLRKQIEEATATAAAIDPQAAETLKAEKETLIKTLEEQTAKIQQLETDLAASKLLSEELSAAKMNLEKMTQENQKLKEDLAAKPAEPVVDTKELVDAKQTIEQLQQEVQTLQEKTKEIPAPDTSAGAQALKAQMESLQPQIIQKETRIQALEKQLLVSQEESAKTNKLIEELRVQLQAKTASLGDSGRNPGMEREVARLEEDLARLRQEKVREEVARSLDREMELKRLCNDLQLQLNGMGKTVDELKKENQVLSQRQQNLEFAPPATPASRETATKNLLAEIQRSESKPSGHEPWMQEKKQLEQHLRQLKDFNTHLLEKEKMIQLELTKSRTQAKGLEKICEEFKHQLEKGAVRK